MTLQDAQNAMRMQRGGIKGWALRLMTYLAIAQELGIEVDLRNTCLLFEYPVVFVGEGQPQGVIV